MINKENITLDRRKKQGEKADVNINIRVTKNMSEWIKKEKLSPTGMFLEIVREVGYKEPKSI